MRGEMVMRGYRLDPAQTERRARRRRLARDRRRRARSIAGRVRVIDRKKDLVITGGVNVSPTEVEGVLAHHAAVRDVCIVGVFDEEWGERVVAYVVASDAQRPPSLDRAPRLRRAPSSRPRSCRVSRHRRRDPAESRREAAAPATPEQRVGTMTEPRNRTVRHVDIRVERRRRLEQPRAELVARCAAFPAATKLLIDSW